MGGRSVYCDITQFMQRFTSIYFYYLHYIMQTGGSLLHLYGISKSVGFGCNFSVKNQTGYAVQHSCNYQKVARSGYETSTHPDLSETTCL